jgi:uncharacterized protein
MTIDLDIPRDQLAELCRQHRIRELSLFGSLAAGTAHPDSDADFLVDFLPRTPLDIDDYERLEADLAHLARRRADVVNLRYLRNPFIRAQALRTRRILYAA